MEPIQFIGYLDRDQIIRLPRGLSLPLGEYQVTLRSVSAPPEVEETVDPSQGLRDWLKAMAEAEKTASEKEKND